MSEQTAAGQELAIQKIYLKDASFEAPNTPDIFRSEWKPDVNIQLGNTAKILGDDLHEVVLSITVTCKIGEDTAYLVEVQQAGIFTIKGIEESQLGPVVGSFCPNILFPYAREAISDIVTKAGFPQLLLSPVNFDALYQQHVAQQQQQPAGEAATTH